MLLCGLLSSSPSTTAQFIGSVPGMAASPNAQAHLSMKVNFNETFSTSISAPSAVQSVLLIITGLGLSFAGFTLFRPVLFVTGFYFSAALAFLALAHLHAATHAHMAAACSGAGVAGGLVTATLWRVGLSITGGLLGLCGGLLALLLLAPDAWLLGSYAARVVLPALLLALGAAAIHFVEKPLLIASTAVVGSLACVSGIDTFARAGFADAVVGCVKPPRGGWPWPVYAVTGGWLVLALAGCAVQSNCGSGGRGLYPYSQFRNKKWTDVKAQWDT
ncbi:hypothetical protein SeLEV6574_g01895 [Synchytrium endobioticum]|nr:hypothetical protein SeLEV6574_g01895 [Synchytrium endobioticum]